MAGDSNNNHNKSNNGKPKKRKYLPHSRVRKGSWPRGLAGVQGFFITCEGGGEMNPSIYLRLIC